MPTARGTDLQILLTAVDRTRSAFNSASGRMNAIAKVAKIASKAIAAIGASALAAFSTAAANGQRMFEELDRMGKLLGTNTREADGLVKAIQDFSPGAGIDQVQEALITLQEGFFDAHAESGPLFDLIKDFGANVDLSLDDPRQQLVEFLRALQQLGTETDRVGAIVANFGGEDAKPFLPLARDAGKLQDAIDALSGSISEIPDVISEEDREKLDAHRNSVVELTNAWNLFSQEAFLLISGPLTTINGWLISMTENATRNVTAIGNLINKFKDLVGIERGVTDLTGGSLESIANFGSAGSSGPTLPTPSRSSTPAIDPQIEGGLGIDRRPNGSELNLLEFDVHAMRQRLEQESPGEIAFLSELDEQTRFSRNEVSELSDSITDLQAANDPINSITQGLSAAAGAFGAFGDAAGAGSNKAFKAFQVLQIALSTASAISGAVQTLADPSLGFFGKLGAYARIIATGFAAVSQLRKLRVGSSSTSAPTAAGGGASSSTSFSSEPEVTQSAAPQRIMRVSIQGNAPISVDQLEEFIDAINDIDTSRRIESSRIAA